MSKKISGLSNISENFWLVRSKEGYIQLLQYMHFPDLGDLDIRSYPTSFPCLAYVYENGPGQSWFQTASIPLAGTFLDNETEVGPKTDDKDPVFNHPVLAKAVLVSSWLDPKDETKVVRIWRLGERHYRSISNQSGMEPIEIVEPTISINWETVPKSPS